MTADTNQPGIAPVGRMRSSVRQSPRVGPLIVLTGLLAVAFVVFGFRLLSPAYPGGDLLYHGALALGLLRDGLPMGGAYAGLPAYYPPGYHLLLATLVGMLGISPVEAAGILFLALLPVLVIGTYLLADRLTGRPWVAVLAVAITLFGGAYDLNPLRQWVNSMFMGGQAAWTSYPRDLVFAILPVAAYAFVRALEPGAPGRRAIAWACVAGLLLGGAALVQVQLLLPIPLALAATALTVAVRDPARRRRAVAALVVCGVIAAAMAAPWLLGTLDDVRRSGGVALDSSDQLEPARFGLWSYPREFGLLLPLGLLGAGAMLLFLRRPDGPRPIGEPGPWTPALREGGVLLVTWWVLSFTLAVLYDPSWPLEDALRPQRLWLIASQPLAILAAVGLTTAAEHVLLARHRRWVVPVVVAVTLIASVPATYATASLVARTWTRDAYAMLDREHDRLPHFDALLGRTGPRETLLAPEDWSALAWFETGLPVVAMVPPGYAKLAFDPARLTGASQQERRAALVGAWSGDITALVAVADRFAAERIVVPRNGDRWALLDLAAAAVARADPAAAVGASLVEGNGWDAVALDGGERLMLPVVPAGPVDVGVRVARLGGDEAATRLRVLAVSADQPAEDRELGTIDITPGSDDWARGSASVTVAPGRAARDRGHHSRSRPVRHRLGSTSRPASRLADRVPDRRGHRPRARAVTRWLRRPVVWLPISGFLLLFVAWRSRIWEADSILQAPNPLPLAAAVLLGAGIVVLWALRSRDLLRGHGPSGAARSAPAHGRVREHDQQPHPGFIRRGRAGVAAPGASRRAVRDGCRSHHRRARRRDRLHDGKRPRRLGRLPDGPRAAAAAGAAPDRCGQPGRHLCPRVPTRRRAGPPAAQRDPWRRPLGAHAERIGPGRRHRRDDPHQPTTPGRVRRHDDAGVRRLHGPALARGLVGRHRARPGGCVGRPRSRNRRGRPLAAAIRARRNRPRPRVDARVARRAAACSGGHRVRVPPGLHAAARAPGHGLIRVAERPAPGRRRQGRHRRRSRRPGRRPAAGHAVTAAGLVAATAVLLAVGGAVALVLPAVRRTGLGIVHPAIAWLALHAVFFAAGAAILAATGAIEAGPAWYVAGAALATAIGVLVSDRLAQRRGAGPTPPVTAVGAGVPDTAPVRPIVVAALLGVALAAVAPGLVTTGLPLLASDPTGARSELAGLVVQPLRIALPAAAVVAMLAVLRRPSRGRVVVAVLGIGLAVGFTVLLASRYLAAELVAALVVAWLLAGRWVDVRVVAVLALAGAFMFGAVQVVRAPERSSGRELAFAMERTVSRVVLVQPRTLDALMGAVPDETPFFGGLTWLRRAAPIVGRDDVPNLGYWIYPRLFPDQDPGIRGYAAPGLIGEAWANFGLAGLALFAGLGVVLERLGALVAQRRHGTGDVAAGAVLIVMLARTHALGLNGALVLVVLLAGWRVLAAADLRSLARDVGVVLRWRA